MTGDIPPGSIYNDCTGWHTPQPPQQGWLCPRCGAINAPWVSQCMCMPRGVAPYVPVDPYPTWPSNWVPYHPWWENPTISTCGTYTDNKTEVRFE
jgi:hypothetical protein